MGGKSSKQTTLADPEEAKLPENAGEYERLMAGKLVASADLNGDAELQKLASEGKSGASCLKAVMRELRTMRRDLPVNIASTTFVRYDKAKPYLMKVLIVGPAGTPYDGGCFVFNVVCPPEYPAKPPKVLLETTGGGTWRANPNLYSNGKVCLSLLGTWSGSGCEQWGPTSTLLQVFVSITGLIMVEEPWFNEPGRRNHNPDINRIRNDSNGGLNTVRDGTLRFAVADMLRHPPACFADVVAEHFSLRKAHCAHVASAWVEDCKAHSDGSSMSRAAELAIAALDGKPAPAAVETVPPPPPAATGAGDSPPLPTEHADDLSVPDGLSVLESPLVTADGPDVLDLLPNLNDIPQAVDLELEMPRCMLDDVVNPADLLELEPFKPPSPTSRKSSRHVAYEEDLLDLFGDAEELAPSVAAAPAPLVRAASG